MADVRVPTGIAALDSALGGGLPEATVTLVRGPPGAGKTTLALRFLAEGARRGERCFLLSVDMDEDQLARACRATPGLGDATEFWQRNLIVQHLHQTEHLRLGYLTQAVEEYPAVDRLVVDNLDALRAHTGEEASLRELGGFCAGLRRRVRACLLLWEAQEGDLYPCDGLFSISIDAVGCRWLEPMRMRYVAGLKRDRVEL